MLNIAITGAVMMIFTFVAIGIVDKYGRKILLLIGSLGLAGSYVLIGLSYMPHFSGFHVLTLNVLVIALLLFAGTHCLDSAFRNVFKPDQRGRYVYYSFLSLVLIIFTVIPSQF